MSDPVTVPDTFHDPLYDVMLAQASNIARMESGLVLEGTDAFGNERVIHSPRPNLIRLYDTPLRLIQENILENWQRIVTITPNRDQGEGAVVHRNDRVFRYTVYFALKLTDQEVSLDANTLVDLGDRLRIDNPMARKTAMLRSDWHQLFYDNLNLITADCQQGLVDHASYVVDYIHDVGYPYSMFAATVEGRRSGY